jgi:hypothetical protein
MNPRTLSVVRAVVAALALTIFGTASARGNDGETIAANDDTTETARLPAQGRQPESRFHLDALSLNVYGLA